MSEYIYETVTTEDGNHRANVILDTFADDLRPDGDGYGTVLYQGRRCSVELWCERYKSTDYWEDVYAALWSKVADLDQIEAVLRGKANVCECGRLLKYVASEGEWVVDGALVDSDLYCPLGDEDTAFCEPSYDFSDNPVVGFDITELQDGRLINIVSLADLKVWGCESIEGYNEAMIEHNGEIVDPSIHNLDDFEAYVNGDVYLVTVETKVIEHTKIRSISGDVIREIEHEAWDDHEDDTVHGFYGSDSALEYAKYVIEAIENDNNNKEG